jgi:hypothetical protein
MSKKEFSLARLLLRLLLKPILFIGLPIVFAMNMLPGPNGEPVLNWRKYLPSTETLSSVATVAPITEALTPDVKVYRWQDAKGRWVYSQEPSSEHASEELHYSVHANTQAPIVELDLSDNKAATDATIEMQRMNPLTIIEDAKKVQELSKQRNQALDNL